MPNKQGGPTVMKYPERFDGFVVDLKSKGISLDQFLWAYNNWGALREIFEWSEINKFVSWAKVHKP